MGYASAMPRWEPNATDRLVRAALDLFIEQGYDNTTVAQIAERAGLTKSTFFRHVRDKREVLFITQDSNASLLAETIVAAPASATPLEAVGAALEAVGNALPPQAREQGPERMAVIATNHELGEREALKNARFAASMTDALRARGVPDPIASLAAEIGVLAFKHAYARWANPTIERSFSELLTRALEELKDASAALA
jgi:AcrR family transcriptional regulator